MEKMPSGSHSFRIGPSHRLRSAGAGVLLAMALSGTALAQQQVRVSGAVTTVAGAAVAGVRVRGEGAGAVRAYTNANGRYTVMAPTDAVLNFTLPGQKPVQMPVIGRTTVDVTMQPIVRLEEVVVTAYTEQRRADITGAVGSVNLDAVDRQTSASVLQRLDASVSGVTVEAAGSPGGRSTVRIRGVSSFQNNDPLYVVDGVPVQDSYINWLNPNDITSIQVLKDASAASIYGSRASNGVIVIETTKRGAAGPPRMTFTARQGISTATRGYNDFLITN